MSIFNRSNDPDHFRGRKDYSTPTPTPAPDMGAGLPNLIDESLLSVNEVPKKSLNLGPLDIAMPDPNSPGNNIVVTMPNNFEEMVENRDIDGMTLYPIINSAVGFGPEAERILRKFSTADVPFGTLVGSDFDTRGYENFMQPQDIGSATQDNLFGIANLLEEWIARPVSGFVGELIGGATGSIAARDFNVIPNRLELSLQKLLSIPGVSNPSDPVTADSDTVKDFSSDLAEIESKVNKETLINMAAMDTLKDDPLAATTREELKDVKDKKPVGEGEDEIVEGEEGTGEGTDDDKIGGKDLSATKPVGFFSSDKFLSAIRNVGKSLVEQGQFGSGLALGAVGFADEQAQRQLLAEQRQAEINQLILEKSLEGQEPLGYKELESLSGYEDKINANARYFQGGQVAIGFMDIIIKEIVDNPGKIGGFQGFIDSSVQKISNFLNMDTPWETMSAQAKVEALAKVVQQGNLQAILGESGRTISDKDREIVKDVFGTPGLFDNPDTALTKLRASRDKLAYENQERKQRIISDFTKIQMPVYRQPGQIATLQLTPIVQLIQGSDPYSPNSSNVGNLTATIKTIPLRPKD